MNIQSEIRDYINSHDFVMLPGIGAFLAEYSQPYLNANGQIVEPVRKIRFNSELRNDSDVEILEEFKERLNCTTQEVQNQYFELLDEIDESIIKYGHFYWDGLGNFLKPSGKDLHFVPVEKYGIQNLKSPSQNENLNKELVLSEPEIPEAEVLSEETHKKGSSFLRYVLFIIPPLVLSAALIYTIFFKPKSEKPVKEETVLFSEEEMKDAVVDTLFNEPDTIATATSILQDTQKQHIVGVGIYKQRKDADDIATFLAENGYPSRVRPHGKLFKVYLVAISEGQAYQYVEEVEQLLGDKPVYEK